MSWTEFAETWGRVTGTKISYKQVSFDDMVADTAAFDEDTGIETAWMYAYSSDPGYDGGLTDQLLKAEDIRKVSNLWVRVFGSGLREV